MGVSLGAALAVNLAAVEERIKAVVMLDGGFYNEKPLTGTDQADFAPHLKAPTLLISGRFDFGLPRQGRADQKARHPGGGQEGHSVRYGARRVGAADRHDPRSVGLAGQVPRGGSINDSRAQEVRSWYPDLTDAALSSGTGRMTTWKATASPFSGNGRSVTRV